MNDSRLIALLQQMEDRQDKFILVGHEPKPATFFEWARWFEQTDQRVLAQTLITSKVFVSTVFLGLDHNFGPGAPVLFETMTFGGPLDQEMRRYRTWDEAVIGHQEAIERAKRAIWQRLRKRKRERWPRNFGRIYDEAS